MTSKSILIATIDKIIAEHGDSNPELLKDLQAHRSAIANAFTKQEIMRAALSVADFIKIIYDYFLKQ